MENNQLYTSLNYAVEHSMNNNKWIGINIYIAKVDDDEEVKLELENPTKDLFNVLVTRDVYSVKIFTTIYGNFLGQFDGLCTIDELIKINNQSESLFAVVTSNAIDHSYIIFRIDGHFYIYESLLDVIGASCYPVTNDHIKTRLHPKFDNQVTIYEFHNDNELAINNLKQQNYLLRLFYHKNGLTFNAKSITDQIQTAYRNYEWGFDTRIPDIVIKTINQKIDNKIIFDDLAKLRKCIEINEIDENELDKLADKIADKLIDATVEKVIDNLEEFLSDEEPIKKISDWMSDTTFELPDNESDYSLDDLANDFRDILQDDN